MRQSAAHVNHYLTAIVGLYQQSSKEKKGRNSGPCRADHTPLQEATH